MGDECALFNALCFGEEQRVTELIAELVQAGGNLNAVDQVHPHTLFSHRIAVWFILDSYDHLSVTQIS